MVWRSVSLSRGGAMALSRSLGVLGRLDSLGEGGGEEVDVEVQRLRWV